MRLDEAGQPRDAFAAQLRRRRRECPAERRGQRYFNALSLVRPDLAGQVVGTALDPFYLDDRLPEFMRFVDDNWVGSCSQTDPPDKKDTENV